MTTTTHTHSDGCLLCAVRALTEGQPPVQQFTEIGQEVTGVALRLRETPSRFGLVDTNPALDLWMGGRERIQIVGYGTLAAGIRNAEIKIGDTVTVRYDGIREIETGKQAGRQYKVFTVSVVRGHH